LDVKHIDVSLRTFISPHLIMSCLQFVQAVVLPDESPAVVVTFICQQLHCVRDRKTKKITEGSEVRLRSQGRLSVLTDGHVSLLHRPPFATFSTGGRCDARLIWKTLTGNWRRLRRTRSPSSRSERQLLLAGDWGWVMSALLRQHSLRESASPLRLSKTLTCQNVTRIAPDFGTGSLNA
jgi:hypothetical protein